MLYFLLYNCGLELLDSLPVKTLAHSAIKNDLKKRKKNASESLLDLAIHQSALNSKEKSNRGRPDIVHHCILQFLFSSLVHPTGLNLEKTKPRLLIHSINNNFFEVPSSWRPPSHYIRFRGLLEFLYSKNYLKISNDEEINLENGTLNQIIEKINPKTILVFTSHGNQEPETIQNFSKLLSSYYSASEPIVCLIGGYQYGPAPDRLLSTLKDKKIKVVEITLPGGRLPSWKVLNLALYSIEWDVSF